MNANFSISYLKITSFKIVEVTSSFYGAFVSVTFFWIDSNINSWVGNFPFLSGRFFFFNLKKLKKNHLDMLGKEIRVPILNPWCRSNRILKISFASGN